MDGTQEDKDMSDLYREVLVKRKTTGANQAKKVGLIALIVLGVLAGLVFWPALIVAAAAAVASYFIIPKLDVEYEYLYVNGDLDVDAIYSRQKRKRVAEYHVEELEILAPENSHALDSFRSRKEIKIRDFSSGEPQAKAYVMVMNKEKGQEFVKVELEDAIISDIRRMAPRKVNLY
jgi:hypothetical protein